MFWSMAAKNRKMSAITSAVKLVLSDRRAEFVNEIHKIEGKANERGGGVVSLRSGTFVGQFADAIEAELRKRAKVARDALVMAIKSQELKIRQKTVKQVRKFIREVWNEETQDLCDWYEKRVQSANDEIARERPFGPPAEAALLGVFVDIENIALAPGLLARNKDKIMVTVVLGIIGIVLLILRKWLLSLLFPGNGSN